MNSNISERLHAAISEILSEDDSDMLLNKWVLVLDAVTDGGGRICAYLASEGLSTWEVIGLAEAGSEYARAQLTYNFEEQMLEDVEDVDDEDGDNEEDSSGR